MVNDGKRGRLIDDSFVKAGGSSEHNRSFYQGGEGEKIPMDTQGRGFSDTYRNSSEELFIKSLMETTIGMSAPTMEMLGLKNLSQNLRTDSEELFKSWLTNGESTVYPSSIANRTRQSSRRISSELSNLSNQHHGGTLQNKRSNGAFAQNNQVAEVIPSDLNQESIRNAVEGSMQANNLYLAKAWFHNSQPMTRSRSSELRKRYAAMKISPSTLCMESMQDGSEVGMNILKQEFADPNGYTDLPVHEIASQFDAFMSPSNSSSSTFNNTQMGSGDRVSSVVNMLKGTLERKKLNNEIEKDTTEDRSNALSQAQEITVNSGFDLGNGNSIVEIPSTYQEISPFQLKSPGFLHTFHGSISFDLEGFGNPVNATQLTAVSEEPCQSDSSAAALVVSSGFDACDGPSNSNQAPSISESSKKEIENGRSSENTSRAKDFREQIIDNLKDDRKRGGLVRYNSETSLVSVEKVDPTKKRRVERSRKMAEAKERNLVPAIPSDMQAVVKRCENLEKEVRSLKLNLSFMNRKDSEQTKQIEELQKQNEDLTEEKERLLEEIERILSETGNM
ncbi:hypothetical protein K2173_009524 [Erythroxylum novogranatense]|uniref:Protein CYCLOPS n=1 Tax=Erythroxylum novogranatense TaxID=1862640 RepID=A0AAV8U8C5_9ROSI|nr:hypothetical protein K2173_009524 [Erythroxylum novogranatense]